MPSAAEIYSQIRPQAQLEGPLDQYTKMLSVKSLIGQQGLQELQTRSAQRTLDQEEASDQAFRDSGGDLIKARDLLFQRGASKPALAMESLRLKTEKEAADLAKTKVETHAAQIKTLRDQTATVQSDADLEALRERATSFYGPKVAATIPLSVNDPNFAAWQRKAIMSGDKLVEQTTPKMEKFDLGGKVIAVDVNPVTNPAIKTLGFQKTMTPGEVASNKVALANLRIKGAEATPGGVFSIPDIVAQAGGGGGAPGPAAPVTAPAAAGTVTPAQLLRGQQNALPQAAAASPAPAQAAAPSTSNPVQAALASGATGEDLLKQVPKPLADQVKMMVEGRMAPPTSFAASKPYWQGMLSLAAQYDPGFDETLWKSRNATRTAFASGAEGKNLTKINTAIGHLDSFDKAAQALNNGDYPLFNKLLNAAGPQVGATNLAGRIRTFDQAKEAVANELMSVFRGVGASSGDTAKWAETLNAADSPEALRAAVKSATDLLESRIGALTEQYKKGMSTKNEVDILNMVYPKARSTLERLKAGKSEAPELGSQVSAGQVGGRAAKPTGGIKFLGFEQ